MATIQINRTKTGVVPGALADGELYIDQLNNKLYWADSTGAIKNMTLIIPTFAPSATTDTTNASNITSGILAAAQGGVPAGAVLPFAMQAVPQGWLECDGAAVSRTTYAALFAAIGTTYGAGDGSTTFNLPALRGRFVRGWDHGAGVDSGRTLGSYQADDNAPHTHTVTDDHKHQTALTSGGPGAPWGLGAIISGLISAGVGSYQGTYTSPTQTGSISLASQGAEGRPKNIAMMYCIKF